MLCLIYQLTTRMFRVRAKSFSCIQTHLCFCQLCLSFRKVLATLVSCGNNLVVPFFLFFQFLSGMVQLDLDFFLDSVCVLQLTFRPLQLVLQLRNLKRERITLVVKKSTTQLEPSQRNAIQITRRLTCVFSSSMATDFCCRRSSRSLAADFCCLRSALSLVSRSAT